VHRTYTYPSLGTPNLFYMTVRILRDPQGSSGILTESMLTSQWLQKGQEVERDKGVWMTPVDKWSRRKSGLTSFRLSLGLFEQLLCSGLWDMNFSQVPSIVIPPGPKERWHYQQSVSCIIQGSGFRVPYPSLLLALWHHKIRESV
jgi:hypothetical protein